MTRVLFNSQITVGPLVVPGENDFYINVGLTGRQTNFSLKERSLSLLVGGGKIDRVEPENGNNSKTRIVSEDVLPNYILLVGIISALIFAVFLLVVRHSSNYDRS